MNNNNNDVQTFVPVIEESSSSSAAAAATSTSTTTMVHQPQHQSRGYLREINSTDDLKALKAFHTRDRSANNSSSTSSSIKNLVIFKKLRCSPLTLPRINISNRETRNLTRQEPFRLTENQAIQLARHQRTLDLTKITMLAHQDSQRTGAAACFAALMLYICTGVAYFRLGYHWKVKDALLFTVYTFTTIGYGNHDIPQDTTTYAFLSMFAFVGVGIWAVVLLQMQNFIQTEARRLDGRRVASHVQQTGDIIQSNNRGSTVSRLSSLSQQQSRIHHNTAQSNNNDNESNTQNTRQISPTNREIPHGNEQQLGHQHWGSTSQSSDESSSYTSNPKVSLLYSLKMQVLHLLSYFKQSARYYTQYSLLTRFATILIPMITLMLPGILIIYLTEPDWSIQECFYFTVITLTTVGLGDLYPTTNTSIWFCIFYLPLSTGFMSLFIKEVVIFYVECINDPNVKRIQTKIAKDRQSQMIRFDDNLEIQGEEDLEMLSNYSTVQSNGPHSPLIHPMSPVPSSPSKMMLSGDVSILDHFKNSLDTVNQVETSPRALNSESKEFTDENSIVGPFLFLGKVPPNSKHMLTLQVEHRLAFLLCKELFAQRKGNELIFSSEENGNNSNANQILKSGKGTAASETNITNAGEEQNSMRNLGLNRQTMMQQSNPVDLNSTSEDGTHTTPTDHKQIPLDLRNWKEITDVWMVPPRCKAGFRTVCMRMLYRFGSQFSDRCRLDPACKSFPTLEMKCMAMLLKTPLQEYRALISPFMIPMSEDMKQMELWLAGTSLMVFKLFNQKQHVHGAFSNAQSINAGRSIPRKEMFGSSSSVSRSHQPHHSQMAPAAIDKMMFQKCNSTRQWSASQLIHNLEIDRKLLSEEDVRYTIPLDEDSPNYNASSTHGEVSNTDLGQHTDVQITVGDAFSVSITKQTSNKQKQLSCLSDPGSLFF